MGPDACKLSWKSECPRTKAFFSLDSEIGFQYTDGLMASPIGPPGDCKTGVILVTWKYMRMVTKHHMLSGILGLWSKCNVCKSQLWLPRHKLDCILLGSNDEYMSSTGFWLLCGILTLEKSASTTIHYPLEFVGLRLRVFRAWESYRFLWPMLFWFVSSCNNCHIP